MGGNFRRSEAFFDLSLLAQKREALAVSVKARAHAHRCYCHAGLEKGRQLWPFTKPLQQPGD